jgi:molecular chaperone GrpE
MKMDGDPETAGSPAESPTQEEAGRAEEYLAGWKRAAADYDNLKKEIERTRSEQARFAASATVVSLLPIVDTLKTALSQKPDSGDSGQVEKWIEGIDHTLSSFNAMLQEAGVSSIEETGVPFDPAVHEAVLKQSAEGAEADTVLKVVEPGYRMHERVLRPAKVIVAE